MISSSRCPASVSNAYEEWGRCCALLASHSLRHRHSSTGSSSPCFSFLEVLQHSVTCEVLSNCSHIAIAVSCLTGPVLLSGPEHFHSPHPALRRKMTSMGCSCPCWKTTNFLLNLANERPWKEPFSTWSSITVSISTLVPAGSDFVHSDHSVVHRSVVAASCCSVSWPVLAHLPPPISFTATQSWRQCPLPQPCSI